MYWSDLPRHPARGTLRQFAALWLVVFGGLALWYGLHEGQVVAGRVLAALALTVGPVGLVWPAAVRPVFVGWLMLTFPVGWVVSRLVLAALFYVVFTPLALWFRLIGRDVLGLRPAAGAATYWQPKRAAADKRSYFRQY